MPREQTRKRFLEDALTIRQCEYLSYVANGYSSYDIARLMGVSRNTVRDHAANVRRNLGARNASHAVALAWRLGLIE